MMPAIIIARGGSKRVPRKNVRDFCGKPLVEWTIIQAKQCEGIDLIVLSTDDDEIAEIGKRHEIIVYRRPVLDDSVSGMFVFLMAVDRLKADGFEFDAFTTLLPTGPLRMPGDLDRALSIYYSQAYPIKTQVVSAVQIGPMLAIPECEGKPFRYKNWAYKDCETIVLDIGLFSICDVDSYRKCLHAADHQDLIRMRKIVRKIHPVMIYSICKPWQWCDIDTEDDFELAELLFQYFILDKGYYQ